MALSFLKMFNKQACFISFAGIEATGILPPLKGDNFALYEPCYFFWRTVSSIRNKNVSVVLTDGKLHGCKLQRKEIEPMSLRTEETATSRWRTVTRGNSHATWTNF